MGKEKGKKKTKKGDIGTSVKLDKNQINSSFASIRPIDCMHWFQTNLRI